MNTLELKIPPVAIVLLIASLMWLAAWAVPELTVVSVSVARWTALWLAAAGLFFGLAGIWSFRQARTTIDPTQPDASSSVVTTGIYRVSRNPMYVGLLLGLTGWACWLANVLALLGLPTFVWYMNRFQILPEERVLATKFGKKYRRYRQAVRRWL